MLQHADPRNDGFGGLETSCSPVFAASPESPEEAPPPSFSVPSRPPPVCPKGRKQKEREANANTTGPPTDPQSLSSKMYARPDGSRGREERGTEIGFIPPPPPEEVYLNGEGRGV